MRHLQVVPKSNYKNPSLIQSLFSFLYEKQYEYRIRMMALIMPRNCYITISCKDTDTV